MPSMLYCRHLADALFFQNDSHNFSIVPWCPFIELDIYWSNSGRAPCSRVQQCLAWESNPRPPLP
uniref:Uncharacterized protein n=1 Tax=Anguilla anguilla TaxID=7936 RepID=A0A0E9SJS8_ANGAN